MANQRLLEIAKRAPNGEFQNILHPPYRLGQQQLVRIGSAPQPRGDLEIPQSKKSEVEPLHMLLRARGASENSYELLNVSAQPLTVYSPTKERGPGNPRIVEPNDGAVPLADYDYVEFGRATNSDRDNFQLTYLSGEWVTIDLQMKMLNKVITPRDVTQYKLTFQQGDVALAEIKLMRCENSPHIRPEDELNFTTEILGLDERYFTWEVKRTNKFYGIGGGATAYKLTCTADTRTAITTPRIHFLASLYHPNGQKLHTVARSAIFEVVPVGPFELEFGPPRQRNW